METSISYPAVTMVGGGRISDTSLDRVRDTAEVMARGREEQPEPEHMPSSYYQKELEKDVFNDIDAVILDECAVIDILRYRSRRRNINGATDMIQAGYKTLELMDTLVARNEIVDDPIDIFYVADNCKYHPNGMEEGTFGYHLLTSVFDYMQDIGEEIDPSAVDDEIPDYWQRKNMEEDWKIGQFAADKNAMIISTDNDFSELEDNYDFPALPPDVATLGFKGQIEEARAAHD